MKYPNNFYRMMKAEGRTGTIDEMMASFYRSQGATGSTLNSLEYRWLASQGFSQPTINERWYAYLRSKGLTGSISDMRAQLTGFAPATPIDPATLFSAGQKGVWFDPTAISTMFQDSAGTTAVTATGQLVGRFLDKSGRGNHLAQATGTQRTAYRVVGNIKYQSYDGTDDGLPDAAVTFGVKPLEANMDFFMAMRKGSPNSAILCSTGSTGSGYHCFMAPGGTGIAHEGSGSPVYVVDGKSVNNGDEGTTQGQLYNAISQNEWHVVEARRVDMSAWAGFSLSNYAVQRLGGDIAGVIVCPAQTEGVRSQIRTYLGKQVGLSL